MLLCTLTTPAHGRGDQIDFRRAFPAPQFGQPASLTWQVVQNRASQPLHSCVNQWLLPWVLWHPLHVPVSAIVFLPRSAAKSVLSKV